MYKKYIVLAWGIIVLFVFYSGSLAQNLFQVTHETLGEGVSDFVWSPDGTQFAYIAVQEVQQEGIEIRSLFLINKDGSDKNIIRSDATGYLDWKTSFIKFFALDPDVPVPTYYNDLIQRINPDGSNETTIKGPYWFHGGFLRADGNWLLYDRAPNGWWRTHRCDINGVNDLEVSHSPLVQRSGWLGTDYIIYARGDNYWTPCGMHRVNFDGTGHIPLTETDYEIVNNTIFNGSPNADKILYCNGSTSSWDIWIMDADGGNKTQLTTDPAHDYLSNPRDNIWSLDRQSFYFISERTGNGDIYTINIDGSGLNRVTSHDALDTNPVPSPSYQYLAFISNRDGTKNIWIIDFNNDPEVISIIIIPEPVEVGSEIEFTANFTDIDEYDTHTAIWDWGDGTSTAGEVDQENYTVNGIHSYETPGVYTLSLTVIDNYGGSDTKTAEYYLVIYDPAAGFVTGGGWIDSPVGAYTPDPSLTGKATFGFVSKYKKGQTVPTGNTEFQFHTADFNFHSSEYEWLVIAGAKAMFKGTGTINGEGSYKFMVSAIDGDLKNDGDGLDKFRIKISNTDDVTIYDNQLGDQDDADATTVIGGGSIMIHKGGKFSKPIDVESQDRSQYVMVPEEFSLLQNYPNPFNPITTIRFAIPQEEKVLVEIYNTAGQRITTLVNTRLNSGYHDVIWDASKMPSGIYFYRIIAGEFQDLKKMILMK